MLHRSHNRKSQFLSNIDEYLIVTKQQMTMWTICEVGREWNQESLTDNPIQCVSSYDASNPQQLTSITVSAFMNWGLHWSPVQTYPVLQPSLRWTNLDLFLVWNGIDRTWGLIVDQTRREHILGITSRWPHITLPAHSTKLLRDQQASASFSFRSA